MTSTIELDPSEEHQTIEGFGVSGAWWAQDVGGWEEEQRERIICITETKRLWALGNYSRFVRPGDVRVPAHSRGGALEVVAFRSVARGEICAVVTNPLAEPVPARLSLVSMPASEAMTGHETSEARDLARVYERPMPDTFQFAPRSVTTLIVDCS